MMFRLVSWPRLSAALLVSLLALLAPLVSAQVALLLLAAAPATVNLVEDRWRAILGRRAAIEERAPDRGC